MLYDAFVNYIVQAISDNTEGPPYCRHTQHATSHHIYEVSFSLWCAARMEKPSGDPNVSIFFQATKACRPPSLVGHDESHIVAFYEAVGVMSPTSPVKSTLQSMPPARCVIPNEKDILRVERWVLGKTIDMVARSP